MGLTWNYAPGQTPLDEDERDGLRLRSIVSQHELNEAERLNIEQAIEWTMKKRFQMQDILSEKFVLELHRRMYGQVWKWAGQFRRSNKNIGVDKFQVGISLRGLLDDARCWLEHDLYVPDEMALRFKHRLVQIHCFPNGNGRHSRLMADVLATHIHGSPFFTWGATEPCTARTNYLNAVKAADAGNIVPLLCFARS